MLTAQPAYPAFPPAQVPASTVRAYHHYYASNPRVPYQTSSFTTHSQPQVSPPARHPVPAAPPVASTSRQSAQPQQDPISHPPPPLPPQTVNPLDTISPAAARQNPNDIASGSQTRPSIPPPQTTARTQQPSHASLPQQSSTSHPGVDGAMGSSRPSAPAAAPIPQAVPKNSPAGLGVSGGASRPVPNTARPSVPANAVAGSSTPVHKSSSTVEPRPPAAALASAAVAQSQIPSASQPSSSHTSLPKPRPPSLANLPIPQLDPLPVFLAMVNHWQKASPPEAFMDIPHAKIRIIKRPGAQIFFWQLQPGSSEFIQLSAAEALARMNMQRSVSIFVSPQGFPVILPTPLSAEMTKTHPHFAGTIAANAPNAVYPAPGQASANLVPPHGRSPRHVDKRFLAQDILRALGKEQRYRAAGVETQTLDAKAAAPKIAQIPAAPRPMPIESEPVHVMPIPSAPARPFTADPIAPLAPAAAAPPTLVPSSAPPAVTLTPQIMDCVLVPPGPYAELVRRDIRRMRAAASPRDESDVDMRDVDELVVDFNDLKRRRSLGSYSNTTNEGEAAAMLEACSRGRMVRCRWIACDAMLNCLENAVAHLYEHAQENPLEPSCAWNFCGQRFSDNIHLALHVERHVLDNIPCPYRGCQRILRSPAELMIHNTTHTNSQLLPSTRPVAPQYPPDLPPVPKSVPAWAQFQPGLTQPVISRDWHKTLGSRVLQNIFGPVSESRLRRYNAAVPLSGVKEMCPDYEFLESSSRHYSFLPSQPARVREMAALETKEVQDRIVRGDFVLWPQPKLEPVD
ncbi:unnamed protein product [Mycena citricolor]|uniref:C2H2-type domain-containing protein n=1 Tax=Mycena citricolor TaxID=2018698 RepID=A0AAD2HHM0_9AGAR|nr:unnamed protein product [Mycena citricolor]